MAEKETCLVDRCERQPSRLRLCSKHYQRLNNNWNTADPKDIDYRFWRNCEIKETGCWEWLGYTNPAGYGQFGSENGTVMLSHRWAYRRFVGELIDGLTIDHLCRNTKCCNPEHLEQVTLQENLKRTTGLRFSHYAKGDRTHCSKGHELTPENRYKRKGRVNSYLCKICTSEYHRERNRRKKNERDSSVACAN